MLIMERKGFQKKLKNIIMVKIWSNVWMNLNLKEDNLRNPRQQPVLMIQRGYFCKITMV